MTLHTLPSPPAPTNSLTFHLSPNGVASKSLVLVVLRMIMLMMVMMVMMLMRGQAKLDERDGFGEIARYIA